MLSISSIICRRGYHRRTTRSCPHMPPEDQSTTKRLIILAIDDAWRRLRASFNELRSEDIVEPGACGDWSVNHVLWHISAWELLLMEALETPDDGYDYPEPEPDEFNASATADMSVASPREIVERLESTHRRLRDALANTPPSHFDQDHPPTPPHRRVDPLPLRRTCGPDWRVARRSVEPDVALNWPPLAKARHLARRV